MSIALSFAAEDMVSFRRRPETLPESVFPRRLALNTTPPYKFAYARTALKYGLKSLGLKLGDALLVPEFICEALVEPLAALGVTPEYYRVNWTLEPEWRELEQVITKSTKALLVVHYFGQPQSIPKCLEFCREHCLFLIEDNAHGFGGVFAGQLLGTFGDVGVSAPRKSFSLINGAYLYSKNDQSLALPTLPLEPSASSSRKGYLKRWIKQTSLVGAVAKYRGRFVEYRRRLGPPASYGSQFAFREPFLQDDYGMDESTDSFLKRQDIERIREIRQHIYHVWQHWALAQGLTPVFSSLSPGAMPLVFPAFTDSATSSIRWYELGHRAGIDIHSWPTFPQFIVEKNSGAMRMWERLLCFPIHQEMDVGLLKKRLAVLRGR